MIDKCFRYRLYLFVLVILAVGAGILGLLPAEDKPAATEPLSVSVARVQMKEKSSVLPLPGSIEGITSNVISSRFSGKVTSVLAEDGDFVQKGQLLLILDREELFNALQVAKNNLCQAKARYDNAYADYGRYERLQATGAVSMQQLESYRTSMLLAQAELASAGAQVNNAQKQVDDAEIVSPVEGIVAHKNVTPGQLVSAESQLMTVEQMGEVYAVLHVEQKYIDRLHKGVPLEVRGDAYPGQVFKGMIEVVSPVAGSESRMFRVKVKLPNPSCKLKPGMFVEAGLVTGEPVPVLAVPRQAVLGKKGIQYVFVAEEGKARKVRVETGTVLEEEIEIVSGIQAGDRVLVNSLDQVKDGDDLTVNEVGA